MALTIGSLVGTLRADASGWERGLDRARLRLAGFTRDTDGRLRDMNGRFVNAGDLAGRGWARFALRRLSRGLRSGIGGAFTTGMTGLRGAASSIGSNPYVGAIGVAMAIGAVNTMLPLITALLSAAVISVGGLAVIGLGAALLKDEPKVKKAAGSLVSTVKRIFNDAAKPLIGPFTNALKRLEGTAKDVEPLIRRMFQGASMFVKPLTDGIDVLTKNGLPGFVSMIEEGQPVFDGLEKVLGSVGKGLGNFFRSVGSGSPQAGTALTDLGRAIEVMLTEAGKFIAWATKLYDKTRPVLEKIVGAFRWMYNTLIGNSIVPDLINGIVGWFARLPGRILGKLSGFANSVAGRFGSMKNRAVARVREMVGGVVGTVRSLPGRARAALGSAGSTLYGAGRSIIQGLINGIRSQAGRVAGAVSSVLQRARSLLPFSPAKRGPFSGKGWTLYSGQSMMTGLAKGIGQRQGAVTTAMTRAAQAASMGVPGMHVGGLTGTPTTAAGGGGGAGGRAPFGRVRVEIDLTGADEDLKRRIRKITKVDGGGDVQVAFGRR